MRRTGHRCLMEVYALQVWFGIILAISGLSLHRTGPAFYRNKFGFSLAIIGIITTILIPDKVPEPEMIMQEEIVKSLPWVIPSIVGSYLILNGAPVYLRKNHTFLISGWILLLFSWIYIFSNSSLPHYNLELEYIGFFIGVIVSFAIFVAGIFVAERITRISTFSTPLTDSETSLVKNILSRHIKMEGEGDDY